MKNLKTFLLILFVSVTCFVLSGCSDDDVSATGELFVTFQNSDAALSLRIYAIDNEETPIYTTQLQGPKEFKHKLIAGNYMINLMGGSIHNITKIGFQIRSNTRTSIHYNENYSPSILYK
ncbi:MAG: hypothetical protein LBM08_02800 [Dysgonamonadaceae bacterium]|jgi:uncharacterized lipoprotein YehR (DUF1307 family)|nr:hypothetical protein [Dysgonamonadaceae bacterium]